MRRSLSDISPIPSSHKVGMKRVLLTDDESGCAITQIAVTELKAGKVAETHVHEDMMEGIFKVYSFRFQITQTTRIAQIYARLTVRG